MSIPVSTYLSMSLYLLANQWVAAADLGAARLATTRATERGNKEARRLREGWEKDNAEAQRRTKRFRHRAHGGHRVRGERRKISAEGHRRFYQGWLGGGRRWRRGCCWDDGEKSHTLRARRRRILWRRWGRLVGRRQEPRSWSGLASCGP